MSNNNDFKPQIRFKEFTNAWVQLIIEELVYYIRPDKYTTTLKKLLEKGKIPVLTANKSFLLGYSNEDNFFDQESIIFDDFTLLFKYVNFPYIVKSSAIKILLTDNTKNNLYFISLLLKKLNLKSENHARHYISLVQKTNVKITNFQEQNKISKIFTNLDSSIALLQRKLEKMKNIKEFLLNKMFVSYQAQFPEIRFKEFTNPWVQEQFNSFITWYSQKNSSNLKYKSYSVSNNLGFILQNDFFNSGGKAVHADKTNSKIVRPNSFAFNPSRINIGSIAYYRNQENGLVSNIYETFFTNEMIDDYYLECFFKTHIFKKIINLYKNSGVRDSFSIQKSKFVKINIPSLKEQERIIKLLKTLDSSIALLQRKLKKLENIKSTLLNKMFV
ncbi:restriction endonuclease subunit S [Mycoplasma sp. CSL7503-lung]|uniref:restriction endonuclease subunit S n=1 Tax=Mycoplasma sp. CSL7503-lung TaxID=536372 RepID=UPI0021D39761|nr:restriction endonuclease subunit S [Mycoplasma sp. CSL7503-lung]MCU4706418.1 restriction endonuclease subunit S [Mycoplasma sp. CSL7503-lung]